MTFTQNALASVFIASHYYLKVKSQSQHILFIDKYLKNKKMKLKNAACMSIYVVISTPYKRSKLLSSSYDTVASNLVGL